MVYRHRLVPETVQCKICTQEWKGVIVCGKGSQITSNRLSAMCLPTSFSLLRSVEKHWRSRIDDLTLDRYRSSTHRQYVNPMTTEAKTKMKNIQQSGFAGRHRPNYYNLNNCLGDDQWILSSQSDISSLRIQQNALKNLSVNSIINKN